MGAELAVALQQGQLGTLAIAVVAQLELVQLRLARGLLDLLAQLPPGHERLAYPLSGLGDLALAPELTALTADAPAGVGGALVPDELLEAVVGGEPSVRPVPDAQLVCACNQVTAGTIRAAVADGDDSVEAIRASTGASGGCGGCA